MADVVSSQNVFKTYGYLYPNLSREELRQFISRQLKTHRTEAFMVQDNMASNLGVATRTYQYWEAGKNRLMTEDLQSRVRAFMHKSSMLVRRQLTTFDEYGLDEGTKMAFKYFEAVFLAILESHYDDAIDLALHLKADSARFEEFGDDHDIWIRNDLYYGIATELKLLSLGVDPSNVCCKILDECIAQNPKHPGLYYTVKMERAYFTFKQAQELKSIGDKRYLALARELVGICDQLMKRDKGNSTAYWNKAEVVSCLLEDDYACHEAWTKICECKHSNYDFNIELKHKTSRAIENPNLEYLYALSASF